VPLIVHYPPLFPAARVEEGTEGIDILPTIADALGVAHDPEWQGASLLPLSQGAVGGYPWMSFASKYENGHAGRIDHWKGMLNGAAAPRIYDLAKDKDETKDLYGTAHIGTRLLLDAMWMERQWNVEWKKSQWGNAADVSDRFAADLGE
jgi:arylsulfatase A-like enzyme